MKNYYRPGCAVVQSYILYCTEASEEPFTFLGMRWCSWVRHCATSWKVADSVSDGVIGNFHWYDPLDRTKALGSTQPLTEMSIRNLSLGKNDRSAGLTNLPPSCAHCLEILGASTSLNPHSMSRDYFTFTFICYFLHQPSVLMMEVAGSTQTSAGLRRHISVIFVVVTP